MTTIQSLLWWLAVGLYASNLGVGVAAQLRLYHFGVAHHVLYFFVFTSAIATTIFSFHPLLLVTLGALTYMPVSRPGTWKHPTAAPVGFAGFFLALL